MGNSELLEAKQGRQPQGGGGQLGNESHREGTVKGAEGRFRWPQRPRPRCPEKMHVCLKVCAACQSDGQKAWKLVPEGSWRRQAKGTSHLHTPPLPALPRSTRGGGGQTPGAYCQESLLCPENLAQKGPYGLQGMLLGLRYCKPGLQESQAPPDPQELKGLGHPAYR